MTVSWARLGAGAAIFAAAAGGAALSPIGAPAVQAKLQATAANALIARDLRFASARANGRTLILSGAAPNTELRDEAIGTLAVLPGVSRVAASGLWVAPSESVVASEEAGASPPQMPIPDAPALKPPSASDCQAALFRTLNGRRLSYRAESARLSAGDRALLDEIAAAVRDCANLTIVIEGHTDATGSRAANMRLSERRAKAVEAYLAPYDLPATLVIRAFGESRPIASNKTAGGRSANRRIDFVVETPAPESFAESD